MKRILLFIRQETGFSMVPWIIVALLNFGALIILRRQLAPGQFGTVNTALGIIGMMTVPVLALSQAYNTYRGHARQPEGDSKIISLRESAAIVTETFAWAWGILAFPLLFVVLALTELPRFSLSVFTFLNLGIALGGAVSASLCQNQNRWRLWAGLLVAAALVRVLVCAFLARPQPWAESGLAASLLAGFILLVPALRQSEIEMPARLRALQTVLDRDFLLYLGATFSVVLGSFLFSSADRIVAQSWFGTTTSNNIGYVDWPAFDAYHTAGLLGRALLWGTQPLLLVLFAQRSRLDRTTTASLTWFWIYLGTLLLGGFLLILFRGPLSWIFCGDDFALTARFVPAFAAAMIPLGLLQALGMFALASRRYYECFVLGGCGVGFTLLLYLVGRQPVLMPAYMFGGGLVAMMIVLFVGVVRWGRKQP